MAIDGKALTALGIGTLFVWSGIKGWSVMATVGEIITGKPPSASSVGELVTSSGGDSLPPSGGFAETALRFQGHAYKFGGAPGIRAENPWDCSSFMNYVIGVVHGAPIPGYRPGRYDGKTHGPSTGQWMFWSGLQKVKRSEVQAGDIIVWVGHMGMAISNSQMISALNPRQGTAVTGIEGTGSGPIVTMGRMK